MKNFQSIGTYGDELKTQAEIAKNCKYGIVELGVLDGQTSKIFLENTAVPVYGIDPIIPDSKNSSLIGSIEKIKNNTRCFNNYTFIQDFSNNVVLDWSIPFDYIFIDADHRYDYVKADFDSWFPKLLTNGIVGIHDSAATRGGPYWWDGPSKLSDELLEDKRVEYIETIFTLTLFKKL